MNPHAEVKIENIHGSLVMLREVVIALLRSHPDTAAVLHSALDASGQFRDMLVNSSQSEAFLAGYDREHQFFETKLKQHLSGHGM